MKTNKLRNSKIVPCKVCGEPMEIANESKAGTCWKCVIKVAAPTSSSKDGKKKNG